MTQEERLLNDACMRCENWSTIEECEDISECPVHKLYILATEKRKVKVVERIIDKNVWEILPAPRPEMI